MIKFSAQEHVEKLKLDIEMLRKSLADTKMALEKERKLKEMLEERFRFGKTQVGDDNDKFEKLKASYTTLLLKFRDLKAEKDSFKVMLDKNTAAIESFQKSFEKMHDDNIAMKNQLKEKQDWVSLEEHQRVLNKLQQLDPESK